MLDEKEDGLEVMRGLFNASLRWYKQSMWIQRNDSGVIVGLSEVKPQDYKSLTELRRERAYRATDEAEKQITEYAKKKIAEKKKRMAK